MRSRARALILAVLLCAPIAAFGQAGAPARRITAGTSLPATCISSVVIRDIFYKSGSNAGLYVCTAANTWTLQSGLADVVGPASSTDNAIALFSGTTGKLLKDSAVTITSGNIVTAGTIQSAAIQAPQVFSVAGGANNLLTLSGSVGPALCTDNTADELYCATFSMTTWTAPRTIVLPNSDITVVGTANTQTLSGKTYTTPIVGTVAFAALGTPVDGSLNYCSDCTKATPCASGGSGALAKRINGAWDCD